MPPPAERFVAPKWLRVAGLVGLALALSTFAWWPVLASYPHTQGYDGTFIQEMLESARVAMVRYHELPLWNPYQCGGVPLWDNPQGMGGAPLFWPLVALFGNTTLAMDLWYLLHSAAGFISMYIFARSDLKLSRGASIVSSGMWAFCGAHNQHCCGGGFNWAPFFFLPLSIFLWRRAENDLRYAVGLGILASMTFYGGAVYPMAFVGLILVGEMVTRAWPPERLKGIARAAAVAGLVALCLSASRLIPVYFQIKSHSRSLGDESDALQWTTLKDMFLARTHSRGVPGQQYVWPEFSDYVGPLLLGLAALGVILGGAERPWLVGLLVWAFLLMAGHQSHWAPWSLLKAHIFPFKEMRVPSRFNITVTTFLAAFAGIAIDRVGILARRISGSARVGEAARTFVLTLGLVGVGDVIGIGIDWAAQCFNNPPLAHVDPSPRLYMEGPGLASFLDQPQQNRGRLQCWEEWAFERDAPLWTGDVPQAKGIDATAVVTNVSRTQTTFTFDVDATAPARVLVNSNYDLGWRSSVGEPVRNGKMLAVDVPAGPHHVVVRYWPRGLTLGFGISALSLAGIVAFYVWDARKRRRAPRAW